MVYLDNAATSRKKSIRVLASALRWCAFSANAGRGGHKPAIRAAMTIERTREEIRKRFFDGTVIFTKNCTEAVNVALRGLSLRGQVITTVFDHNAVLRTLKDMSDRGEITLRILQPRNGSFVEPMREALRQGKTSLAVVTARSNVTGQTTDAETLAKIVREESDALFMLDEAQSAGHDRFCYENIDIVATSGHKGLGGLQGSGFLLYKKHVTIKPLLTGGTGTSGNSIEIPLQPPEALEAGTQISHCIISLYYAIRHAFRVREREKRKSERYRAMLVGMLKKVEGVIVYRTEAGVVLLNIKGKNSSEVADELSDAYGVYVRGGLHCAPLAHRWLGTSETGAVRFSFGENNRLWHVLYAAFAVRRIAMKKREHILE